MKCISLSSVAALYHGETPCGLTFLLVLIITTARVALQAAPVVVAFFARPLPTVFTAILAPACIPNRVRQYLNGFHGGARVVAVDD
jgi:hypothetical protein